MEFQIGDKVIHSTYGLGDIMAVENRTIHDHIVSCYEVRTATLTIWVPIENSQESIRAPASKSTFEDLLSVLEGPNEPLLDNHLERKKQLLERMNDGKLISIVRVVRDLSSYGSEKKLNISDKSILDRAIESLLVEWVYSLSVPLPQARKNLDAMLN